MTAAPPSRNLSRLFSSDLRAASLRATVAHAVNLATASSLGAIAAAALAAVLAGCATASAPAPKTAPAAIAPSAGLSQEQVSTLIRGLVERARSLESIQTAAVMEYSGGGRHVKAREQLTVQRPSNLRVEALSPFGVAMVVVANASDIQVFQPSENTLYRGRPTADTLNRFAQIPLAPAPAANLLLGLAPSGEALSETPDTARAENGQVTLSFKAADGSVNELGFAGNNLERVRRLAAGGRVAYEVHYSDFRDIGGIVLAHSLEADFPVAGTQVKFQFQRPVVNGSIASSAFALTPGDSTRQIDLDRTSSAQPIGDNG